MTKKSRRVRRKGPQPKLSEAQLAQPTPVVQEAPLAVETAVKESPRQLQEVDFEEEYQYVVSDLKRVGLLAGAILGGMIILALIVV